VLLLHMNGTNGSTSFTDSSYQNESITNTNGVTHDTSIKKYGSASAYFNGTSSQQLSITPNANFQLGTDAYTLEGWFYLNNTSDAQYIFDMRQSGDTTGLYGVLVDLGSTNNYNFSFVMGGDAIGDGQILGTNLTTGTWYNWSISVTSDGTVYRHFNGNYQGSVTRNSAITSNNFRLGSIYTNGSYFQGYMDEVRLTYGIARYNFSNYTPLPCEYSENGPAVTPSRTVTPSISATPSISVTSGLPPSVTPSVSPSTAGAETGNTLIMNIT